MLMSVLFLGVLLGAAALTIDVGAWYRDSRQAQATADAAALAGAQALPSDPSQAQLLTQQYGSLNGGGVTDVTFQSDYEADDTVTVDVSKNSPAYFAGVFGIGSATVGATASARAGVPAEVSGVAPIVVNKLHPMLSGPGCPCFNVPTTLPLGKTGAPGAFGFVLLDPNANNGVPTLASWIQYGYSGYLPLGLYDSDPGAKFNAGPVKSALSSRMGTDLLFPVYDTLSGGGANAQYNIIGWASFHLTSFNAQGTTGSISGWFSNVIWDGIQAQTNQNLPDFGVHTVELVH